MHKLFFSFIMPTQFCHFDAHVIRSQYSHSINNIVSHDDFHSLCVLFFNTKVKLVNRLAEIFSIKRTRAQNIILRITCLWRGRFRGEKSNEDERFSRVLITTGTALDIMSHWITLNFQRYYNIIKIMEFILSHKKCLLKHESVSVVGESENYDVNIDKINVISIVFEI